MTTYDILIGGVLVDYSTANKIPYRQVLADARSYVKAMRKIRFFDLKGRTTIRRQA